MKKNSGVTMISLVVIVIILAIISSVSIQTGIYVYDDVKTKNYISKLKIIQTKVDNIVEEGNDISSYNFTPLTSIASSDRETYTKFMTIISNPNNYNIYEGNSWYGNSDSHIENYYYFSPKDLEKLGLRNQDIAVAINFQTRNVISKTSLEIDEKIYHRQYDLPGGDKLIR